MRKSSEVVIIGGGSIGCSVAYNLAKKGVKNIVLLEKRYLASGSTGRCAAGFRQQWGTKTNCMISRSSAKIFKTLSEELDYEDIEYRESGYLLIAYEERQVRMLEKNLKLQNSLGIPSRKLSPDEARKIVPYLNTDKMEAAFFCQEDGHVNPFKVTFAYARAAGRLGVEIHTYTKVTGIQTRGCKIRSVVTDHGTIATDTVINATGPYAKLVGQMLGLSHPVEPERHQILITEPMEPMMGPMVMSMPIRLLPNWEMKRDFGEDCPVSKWSATINKDEFSSSIPNVSNLNSFSRRVMQYAALNVHFGQQPDRHGYVFPPWFLLPASSAWWLHYGLW